MPDHAHNRISNGNEFCSMQHADLAGHQTGMSGEKFAWSHEAFHLEISLCEIGGTQWHGPGIAVRFASDLTEDPITPTRFRQHHCRP